MPGPSQYITQRYEARKSANDNALLDLRFRRLLTKEQWDALPINVQNRFCRRLGPGDAQVYKGYIQTTKMNSMGRIFAKLLRVIGAPLPLEDDNENQPAIVTVTEDRRGDGQFWTRQYGRTNGFPQVIHSIKQFTGPTGLYEYIGFGVGMSLTLDVENEALLFRSHRYFIGTRNWRLKLPNFLTPGRLTVGHDDHSDGWFEFTLKLEHRFLGVLVQQSAMFEEENGQ